MKRLIILVSAIAIICIVIPALADTIVCLQCNRIYVWGDWSLHANPANGSTTKKSDGILSVSCCARQSLACPVCHAWAEDNDEHSDERYQNTLHADPGASVEWTSNEQPYNVGKASWTVINTEGN